MLTWMKNIFSLIMIKALILSFRFSKQKKLCYQNVKKKIIIIIHDGLKIGRIALLHQFNLQVAFYNELSAAAVVHFTVCYVEVLHSCVL